MNAKRGIKSKYRFLTITLILCLYVRMTEGQAIQFDQQVTLSEAVILEITEQWRGMVPYERKWIYFRLYEGGRAVYQKLEKTEQKERLRPIRQEMALTDRDYQELIQLLESPDFLDARELYPKQWDGSCVYNNHLVQR